MVASAVLVLLFSCTGFILYARQAKLSKEAEQKNTLKLSFMGEALGCLDVVRTSPGSGSFLRGWRALSEQSTSFDTKKRLATHHMWMLSSIIQTVTTFVILTTGVYLINAQLLSIGLSFWMPLQC